MEREVFARRLRDAAIAARDFGRNFIEEPLPDPMRFRLRLNSSYDEHPRVGDEVVFPDDGAIERAARLALCDEGQVVDELWRDGRVPEWIDVAVMGETGAATLLQLSCCGRFTAEDERLYHVREGRPPFHVAGPPFPVGHQDGRKYSIYDRSECWSQGDVDQLRAHAHKVWSLDLVGAVFDDDALRGLPDLSRMEILELKASSIRGHGLLQLSRFPRLRVLRIYLERDESFRIPPFPKSLAALEVFDMHDPPLRPWGFASLVDRAPDLKSLTFQSRGELFVDGDCPPATQTLRIRATRIRGRLEVPKTIESISADLSEMNDGDVDAWLASTDKIGGLDLGGTPITDTFAETLPVRFGLNYLNVVRTHVSEAAVKRIRDAHPKLRLLPNLKPARSS